MEEDEGVKINTNLNNESKQINKTKDLDQNNNIQNSPKTYKDKM
jgi:hypothetical protein